MKQLQSCLEVARLLLKDWTRTTVRSGYRRSGCYLSCILLALVSGDLMQKGTLSDGTANRVPWARHDAFGKLVSCSPAVNRYCYKPSGSYCTFTWCEATSSSMYGARENTAALPVYAAGFLRCFNAVNCFMSSQQCSKPAAQCVDICCVDLFVYLAMHR